MRKENTESKSTDSELKEAQRSITTKIRILERDSDEKRRKRNKRIYIINGGLVIFLIAMTLIIGFATGKWDSAAPNLIGIFWLGFVTLLELENSNQKWIIDMQFGLRELEREEIDTLMADLQKQPAAPKAKKATK